MRTALIYNFLLEATIIASIAIVLMLIVRRFLGKQLGRKALLFAWILVAVRLLCPLALPNPLINEIRSPFAPDPAIRPIAGQVKVRVQDTTDRLQWAMRDHEAISDMLSDASISMFNGMFAINLMKVYLTVAACVVIWLIIRSIRKKQPITLGRVVMLLCCTVHWFNPLVWLAAHLFEKDAQTAQPGTSKRLAIASMATASLLLVCAFGTAEYHPTLLKAEHIPKPSVISPLPENPTDEQIIARSIDICGNDFFQMDMRNAEWSVVKRSSGYFVNGVQGGKTCELRYLPDGRFVYYWCDDGYVSAGGNRAEVPDDGFGDTLATYCLSLLDAALPGVSNSVEAFEEPILWKEPKVTHAYQSGLTVIDGPSKKAVYFNVDLTGAPRVRGFRLESVLMEQLWKQGLTPLDSVYTDRLCGFAVESVLPPPRTLEVPEGCISAEKALESVVAHVKTNYGETDASLRRFEIRYGLMAEGEPNEWTFFLDSGFLGNHSIDQYEIHIDAHTGEVLNCYGPEDSNG